MQKEIIITETIYELIKCNEMKAQKIFGIQIHHADGKGLFLVNIVVKNVGQGIRSVVLLIIFTGRLPGS
jgi:hypothetical protein